LSKASNKNFDYIANKYGGLLLEGQWESPFPIDNFQSQNGSFKFILNFYNSLWNSQHFIVSEYFIFIYDGSNIDNWFFLQTIGGSLNTTKIYNYSDRQIVDYVTHEQIQANIYQMDSLRVLKSNLLSVYLEYDSNVFKNLKSNFTFYPGRLEYGQSIINFQVIKKDVTKIFNKLMNFSLILSCFAILQLFNNKYFLENLKESRMGWKVNMNY
jgi:hypothetical protein